MVKSPPFKPQYRYSELPSLPRHDSVRKNSSRGFSRTSSDMSSSRMACPKDEDAFSYDPVHLKGWYLEDALWSRLPTQVQASLADVQHAGAAALTGFARLESHSKGSQADKVGAKVPVDELLVSLDDLPPPVFRSTSNASSVLVSDISSPPSAGSSAPQSGSVSPVNSYTLASQPKLPASPLSLGQSLLSKRELPRERSFSTPLEPADAYHDVELSHLRTEALPRLRHKCHKVDTTWYENKHANTLSQDDVRTFENWWAAKKCKALELQESVKRLADERNIAPTGMGWCAP